MNQLVQPEPRERIRGVLVAPPAAEVGEVIQFPNAGTDSSHSVPAT